MPVWKATVWSEPYHQSMTSSSQSISLKGLLLSHVPLLLQFIPKGFKQKYRLIERVRQVFSHVTPSSFKKKENLFLVALAQNQILTVNP